ncbi:hypothetical protein JL722_7502 [Aureococcus anophagefferens]|nr:hypothetical protein JL722_7502 [Aureococcus anophagefferens]
MAPEQEGDDLEADRIIDTFVDDARLKLKRATASLEAMRVTASTKLAAAAAKHAAARRALEGERRTFDREVREAEARNARAEDVVTLNVGGTMFTTSVETLCADADSMLAAMFSGRHALRPADDGSLFIDRDPKHFGLVLNFLRDGPAAVLGLAALVSGPEERLLACAAAGGSVKHDEDRLRALVVREPGHATLAMAALLASGDVIDAHAEASAKTFVDESGRAPPAPIVLGGGRRAWRLRRAGVEPGGSSIASRDEFVKNWRTFTLGRLDRLNWTGVVAAGGAVAACALPVPKWAERDDAAGYFQNKTVGIEGEDNDWEMRVGPFILYHAYWSNSFFDRETGLDHSFACHEGAVDQKEKGSHISGFEESDIDLFLVGLNPSEALEKIKEIHKVLKAAWDQVILRLYSSPAEVLMGFDIDSRSPCYESRLRKYALRGFAVSVPAYDPSRVVASAVLGDAAKTEGLARLLLHAHEDSKHPTRRMDERLAEKRFTSAVPSAVEFIEQDPGRQYVTGSWEPGDRDWYASAYGEAPAAPAFPPLKTPRRAPDPTLLEGVAVACGGDAARVAEAAKAQGYSDAEAAFNKLPPEQKKAFHEYAFLSTEFAQLPSIKAAAIKAAVSSGVAPAPRRAASAVEAAPSRVQLGQFIAAGQPPSPALLSRALRNALPAAVALPMANQVLHRKFRRHRATPGPASSADGDVGAAAASAAARGRDVVRRRAPARRVFVFPARLRRRGADTPAFSFGATAPAPPATSDAAAPAPAAPATADVTPISSFGLPPAGVAARRRSPPRHGSRRRRRRGSPPRGR